MNFTVSQLVRFGKLPISLQVGGRIIRLAPEAVLTGVYDSRSPHFSLFPALKHPPFPPSSDPPQSSSSFVLDSWPGRRFVWAGGDIEVLGTGQVPFFSGGYKPSSRSLPSSFNPLASCKPLSPRSLLFVHPLNPLPQKIEDEDEDEDD
jgi:hypothetical protein